MKGSLPRLLPLLHTLVEERAGRGGFPPCHPLLHEPAVGFVGGQSGRGAALSRYA